MHQSLAVHILERRNYRTQHAARFLGRKRPRGKNLRKILFRKFLDRIHQFAAVDGGAPRGQNSDEIRMA